MLCAAFGTTSRRRAAGRQCVEFSGWRVSRETSIYLYGGGMKPLEVARELRAGANWPPSRNTGAGSSGARLRDLRAGAWYGAFDYVRLTRPEGQIDADETALYGKAARFAVASVEGEVPTFKPWHWQGYKGESCGNSAYGSGVQGSILQVSGWAADNLSGLGVPFSNAPRIDVQVTIWLEEDMPNLAELYADVSDDSRRLSSTGRWGVQLRKGYGNGDTCELGSRESDVYIRIYDKMRESQDDAAYKNAWRFEVELADEPAREVWAGACSAKQSPETIAGWVRWYMARRGVPLPRTVPSILAASPERPNRDTDNTRRLAWLRNQVRPSIDKMRSTGVPLFEIRAALGID